MQHPFTNRRGLDATSATPGGQIDAELLQLCDEFLRTASTGVHAELRQFLIEHGHHPQAGLNTFIDRVGVAAVAATRSVGSG